MSYAADPGPDELRQAHAERIRRREQMHAEAIQQSHASPLRIHVQYCEFSANRSESQFIILTDWLLHKEKTSRYHAYANKNFELPYANADTTGLVAMVAAAARVYNTGITRLEVSTHSIGVFFSSVADSGRVKEHLMRAIDLSGLTHKIIE